MPRRLLAGQKTLLARTMHDIRYDEIHDEFFVTNPFAQAILVFRGGAEGEEAPIRVIQGPRTRLGGDAYASVDRVEIDPVHNELFVPLGKIILVFPRDAHGDVAPIRVIEAPEWNIRTLAVDPIHNLIVAGPWNVRAANDPAVGAASGPQRGALITFKRTDNGKARPRTIIMGPKTGIVRIEQLQLHAPNGWIVAAQAGGTGNSEEPEGTFIGVWSVNDHGDIPPRWKFAGPKSTLKKPRGIALNPKNKEIIIADMRLNSVLTFYFPEIF